MARRYERDEQPASVSPKELMHELLDENEYVLAKQLRQGARRRGAAVNKRPSPAERLGRPDAFLSRTDLRELGLERRAVDAIFRACPVVAIPGYSRPLIRVADYRALIDESTYAGDRVRP